MIYIFYFLVKYKINRKNKIYTKITKRTILAKFIIHLHNFTKNNYTLCKFAATKFSFDIWSKILLKINI